MFPTEPSQAEPSRQWQPGPDTGLPATEDQSVQHPPIQAYPRHPQYGPGVEPADVGPAAGGDLRVADADRDLCLEVLNTAYADGRITAGEHAERIDAASRARIFDDLIPLTRDLVAEGPAHSSELQTATPTNRGPVVVHNPNHTEPDNMVALLGDHVRNGQWRVRSKLQTYVLMGDIDLDFTEAVFESDTIEVEGVVTFGDLNIRVPDGVNVQLRTSNVIGDSKLKGVSDETSAGPTVVIKTVVILGDVTVRGPQAAPSRREKRKERRRRKGHGCGH